MNTDMANKIVCVFIIAAVGAAVAWLTLEETKDKLRKIGL